VPRDRRREQNVAERQEMATQEEGGVNAVSSCALRFQDPISRGTRRRSIGSGSDMTPRSRVWTRRLRMGIFRGSKPCGISGVWQIHAVVDGLAPAYRHRPLRIGGYS